MAASHAIIHDFYPRPPRGGRPSVLSGGVNLGYFYPRPPRGGRLAISGRFLMHFYFYPRPPRGGRPFCTRRTGGCRPISTHALREEGDALAAQSNANITQQFLPTPSARRATALSVGHFSVCTISTHALREEGDGLPCGQSQGCKFLPTPSARRATPTSRPPRRVSV